MKVEIRMNNSDIHIYDLKISIGGLYKDDILNLMKEKVLYISFDKYILTSNICSIKKFSEDKENDIK